MVNSGADRLRQNILDYKNNFLMKTSAERLALIERYPLMQPYQKVALLQCKKYMSDEEKRKFRQVSKNVEDKSLKNDANKAQNMPEL